MATRVAGIIALLFILEGCSSTSESCGVRIGDSSISFIEESPAVLGQWYIDSIICEGNPLKGFQTNATNAINGRCSDLGDTDYDLYWKFRLGMLCYPEYTQFLTAKANVTMVPAFVTFTSR